MNNNIFNRNPFWEPINRRINMAQEVRNYVKENPGNTVSQVKKYFAEKYPDKDNDVIKATINNQINCRFITRTTDRKLFFAGINLQKVDIVDFLITHGIDCGVEGCNSISVNSYAKMIMDSRRVHKDLEMFIYKHFTSTDCKIYVFNISSWDEVNIKFKGFCDECIKEA